MRRRKVRGNRLLHCRKRCLVLNAHCGPFIQRHRAIYICQLFCHRSPVSCLQILERETGIEPATNSLEGCDSTTELLPPLKDARCEMRDMKDVLLLFVSRISYLVSKIWS